MLARARCILAVSAAAALALSCTSYVQRGSTLYAEGRYVEAAAVLEQAEHRIDPADPRENAEYAAYRGLTMLLLGDLRNANRWMAYAYQIEQSNPGALSRDVRSQLERGWADLNEKLSEGPPRKSRPVTALAATQPPELPPPPPDPR